jgi:hypothetical protein
MLWPVHALPGTIQAPLYPKPQSVLKGPPVPFSWALAALDEGEDVAAAWLDSQEPGLGSDSRQVQQHPVASCTPGQTDVWRFCPVSHSPPLVLISDECTACCF